MLQRAGFSFEEASFAMRRMGQHWGDRWLDLFTSRYGFIIA